MYYTLEIGAERMLCRFYAKMASTPTKQLPRYIEQVQRQLARFQLSTNGTIYVKYFPARLASVDMLHNHLAMARGLDINPKLVIVDYADLLRPTRALAKTHEQLRETHEELRAMATEFDVHLMTASQSTRETLYSKIIDLDNLAESWGKAQTADSIVALCQTQPEAKANIARLYVCKARNETRGSTVPVLVNYPHLAVKEIALEDYRARLKEVEGNNKSKGRRGHKDNNDAGAYFDRD